MTDETLRNEQKQEAIARMKTLNLHPNAIKEFEQEGKLNLSEGGILYWLSEQQKAVVEKFEKEYDALVYHVIHNFTAFGELLTCLYVSASSEEWELDREDLKEDYAVAYVENLTDPFCSEIGGVGIKPKFGGVIRTE